MPGSEETSLEAFRALVERAGLSLSEEEIKTLKPVYEFYATRAASLYQVELGPEDMAVSFSPAWEPQA